MKFDEEELPDDQFFDALHRCRCVANLDRQLTEDEVQQYRKDMRLILKFVSPTETPFLDNHTKRQSHNFSEWRWHKK